ncbi:hypothetical protein ACA910_004974 [Epithemia clementina (nom. ined.)]
MTIPVVQGVPVEPTSNATGAYSYYQKQEQHQQPVYGSAAASAPYGDDGSPSSASLLMGEGHIYSPPELRELRQHPVKKFQDVCWAMLFWIHLVVVVGVCMMMFMNGMGVQVQGNSVDIGNLTFVTGVCGFVAVGLCTLALNFMMNNAEQLVQAALVFSVLVSLAMGLLGLVTGNLVLAILGLISFAVGCCYAYAVWNRIPFAAVNLKTALSGVRKNLGLILVAYMFIALAFGWSLLWFLGLGNAFAGSSLAIVFLMFLSYYWTHQVLQNTMHVTTAGVIGTWWFAPAEADRFWATALTDSLIRATTYSFGSICFGSFLVAFVQALRALEHYARGNDDMSFLVCIIQCLLACIQGMMEFLNRWAYIYVGLYGFNYIEAGRNVMTLFQNKGFTVIISDDLASNVLFMMAVGIGLATGIIGLLLGYSDPNLFVGMGFDNGGMPGFLVGFLIGYLFAAIFLGVVDSAIGTVVVCYAEAPAEFQMNHPELATEMRSAWMRAYPEVMH